MYPTWHWGPSNWRSSVSRHKGVMLRGLFGYDHSLFFSLRYLPCNLKQTSKTEKRSTCRSIEWRPLDFNRCPKELWMKGMDARGHVANWLPAFRNLWEGSSHVIRQTVNDFGLAWFLRIAFSATRLIIWHVGLRPKPSDQPFYANYLQLLERPQ